MFKEVQTNRLHGAIACHTLGIKCELRANAYWKNRAVFDHSLNNIINSNVTFRPQ
jgi:exopolysaccharide biosynthesis predicted pyruvyltransferase EpsI